MLHSTPSTRHLLLHSFESGFNHRSISLLLPPSERPHVRCTPLALLGALSCSFSSLIYSELFPPSRCLLLSNLKFLSSSLSLSKAQECLYTFKWDEISVSFAHGLVPIFEKVLRALHMLHSTRHSFQHASFAYREGDIERRQYLRSMSSIRRP